MTPSDRRRLPHVSGEAKVRGVTLALPVDLVSGFLPLGLELGPQEFTNPGLHPVILFFQDMLGAQVSSALPGTTLLPAVDYHEHCVIVPFTHISRGPFKPGDPGPYYFMPKLYLDNPAATAAGLFFWGFAKEFGWIRVSGGQYSVANVAGQPVTSFAWDMGRNEVYRSMDVYPFFEPVLRMLTQPVVSIVPASLGPFFVLSDFVWQWGRGRPLHTAVEVDLAYIPGYPRGRYPASGWSDGMDSNQLGGFEMTGAWRLSVPYLPPNP